MRRKTTRIERRRFLRSGALVLGGAISSAATGRGLRAEDAVPGSLTIEQKPIPVIGEYDVLVCGGGPAGCAAAIAAARHGAKTLLVEKYGFLGGTTVAAGVASVLSTNGVDFQGIWHEWIRRLQQRRGVAELVAVPDFRYPKCPRIQTTLDTELVKWAWDSLIDEAGAEILHFAMIDGVAIENGAIIAVIVYTPGGRFAVRGRRVIDATGDAIVCHEAGVPWHRGVVGKPWAQAVSLNYHTGFITDAPMLDPGEILEGHGGTVGNRPERSGRVSAKRVDPLDPFDRTRAMREIRKQIWERTKNLPPGEYLIDSVTELGVRTSRIVHGLETVTGDDAWELRKPPSTIARSSWDIDVHPPDDTPPPTRHSRSKSEEYRRFRAKLASGEYFGIPYGCLLPRGVENLFVAGRCISSDLEAHGSLRIQQTCIATGQAAGTAAALSVQANVPPRKLDVSRLVHQLEEDRVGVEPAFQKLPEMNA